MKILTIKAGDTESGAQNSYIIEGEKASVIVDAGASIDKVRQATTKPIKAVLITHCHYDHIEFIEDYDKQNISIYAGNNAMDILNSIKANASDLFNNPKKFVINNLKLLDDGQEVNIDEFCFKFHSTPGHTIDSGCYLLKDDNLLFSGDTLFSSGIGRFDLPTGNIEDLKESLKKIQNIEFSILYPGHGEASDKQTQDKIIPKWQRYLNIIR